MSLSLFATISLAESERISLIVTCKRESGRGVPSMTQRACPRVLRVTSIVSSMQVKSLFNCSFVIIFYSPNLFIGIKQDGFLAFITDGFNLLQHSWACSEASPRSIGERKIGGEMVHNAHVSGTMNENISSSCIAV